MKRRTLTALLLLALAGCVTSGGTDPAKMAQGYYDRGISHLQVKDYERAIVEFQRSINTNPKNKMSQYAMGMVYDLMGKYTDAEEHYQEALDIDSDFSEAHNALGTVFMKQKKWKDALKSFRKALNNKLYTTPNITYVNMGDVYMALEDYPKAIESYREAKRFVSQDYIIHRLGLALFKAGNTAEAVGEFREGVVLAPKNPDMRLALALALLKDGNKRSALAEFRKIVELAPQSDPAKTAQDYIATLEKDELKTKKAK